MKLLNKIQKFMYGRYGIDNLYNFLFKLYIVIIIIDLFVKFRPLLYIELLIIIIMFYRCFSKNIYKRQKENSKFLKIKKSIIKPFNNIKRNYKDRKTTVYKKCSKCKTTLKLPLPNKRGINHVICPKCKKRITLLSLRKEQIEIITKKRTNRNYN